MSKNFLQIAIRYLKTKHHDASIKFMIKISFIAMLCATSCLTLVISIMNGFEEATYKKMQSIYPDLIIATHDNPFDFECLHTLIADSKNGIMHSSAQKKNKVFLSTFHDITNPCILMLHGIEPQDEQQVTNLESKIIEPIENHNLCSLIQKNQILIGSQLAKNLNLKINDELFLMYCQDQLSDLCMNFDQKIVTIAGFFQTGIDELDNCMAYCHINFFDSIFPDQPYNQIHLRLKNIKTEQLSANKISEYMHCDIYSWKDLYPAIVSALKLEKYAMICILLLIILIASMNIISLMQMMIVQKKRDIAILLCFGMHPTSIRNIFITMSTFISFCATSFGLLLAFIIGIILQKYPCIKLPDNVYDTDYLPIKLECSVFFIIFITTLVISIITTVLATRHMHKIKIIETLKNS